MDQQVLWFDVAMADSEEVDVRQGSTQLIQIELDIEQRKWHRMLLMTPADGIDSFGNEFQHKIQIQFVWFLALRKSRKKCQL